MIFVQFMFSQILFRYFHKTSRGQTDLKSIVFTHLYLKI